MGEKYDGAREAGRTTRRLGDVYEVLDALMSAYEIDSSESARVQELRRAEGGGFERRTCLL